VFPAERRSVLEVGQVERSRLGQLFCGAFEVNGIPERDRGDDQVKAAGPVALILEGSITDLPEAIEKRSASE
jgi:hypothetical protein